MVTAYWSHSILLMVVFNLIFIFGGRQIKKKKKIRLVKQNFKNDGYKSMREKFSCVRVSSNITICAVSIIPNYLFNFYSNLTLTLKEMSYFFCFYSI